MLLLVLPFDFHNGFWTNLHHFLLDRSAAAAEGATLPGSDRAAWTEALRFYQMRFREDRLRREMATIKDAIEDHENDATLAAAGLDSELRAAMEKAAPVYRAHWWPQHSKTNEAWIAAETPLIQKYASAIIPRLAAAYETPWPDEPIRVDVVWYGERANAYTTLFPTRTAISSSDPGNAGLDGLEILFHEASHSLVAKLQKTISDDARRRGKLLPRRDLWHAMLFYTTGQIVADAVAKDAPGHVPYAASQGLWERSWPGYPQIFEKEWQPCMKGERRFDDCAQNVVDAVLAGR